MDLCAMWLGYAVMVAVGVGFAALAVIWACMAINRASWHVLECYGGLKTFKDFRRWYYGERLAQQATATCAESQTDHA